MKVFFIGTPQDADATLLLQGSHAVLIDTGEAADADKILSTLAECGIDTLDLLILTHPDKDHIGGALQLLDTIKVNLVVEPLYLEENALLTNLNKKIQEKNISVIYPTRTRKFWAGNLHVLVYPPLERNYNKDNNYSLAVLATHKKVNLLFTGDAEKKRLAELTEVKLPVIALYKVSNHGRLSENSIAFLNRVNPQNCIISASAADAEMQAAMQSLGCKTYITVPYTVAFASNGEKLALVSTNATT